MKPSEFIEKIASGELRGAEARRVAAQTEVKQQAIENDKKAEAFDWFEKCGFDYHINYCSNIGWEMRHLVFTDQVYKGKDLLECVRKARGEE